MKGSKLSGIVRGIVGALALLLLLVPQIHAEDEEVLQLRQKITELEGRIKVLESLLEECIRTRNKGTTDALGWQNKKNWRKLELGMSEVQVRSILGEPTKVIEGVKTLWYYPNIYGGFVSFDKNGNLVGWNEP